MGHLVQKHQGVISTKPKPTTARSPEDPIPRIRSNELFLQVTPIIKLYTDDTGRFPIHSRSGNQYIMIAYHCNANLMLAVPFKSGKDTHCLLAYDKIMQRLRDHELTVDLKILYNEAITEYKRFIKKNGTITINMFPQTHIEATQLNDLFTRSTNTLLPYSQVLLHISQKICGTSYSLI